jgi:uncharacterized protein (DUF1684 family)
MVAACSKTTAPRVESGDYEKELAEWKAQRLASLKSDDGWLTLIGLFWLEEGENKFGSDPANNIVLPAGKAPPLAGSLWLEGGAVRLESRPDAGITSAGQAVNTLDLRTDAEGTPTAFELGSLSFHVIQRGDKFALRARDREHPARTGFKGIEYYPIDLKWIVNARLEPYDPPKSVPIANVVGMETEEQSPGAVVFDMGGRAYRIDAIREKGSEQLFLIFADETSGGETYGAGRYLYTSLPDASGRVKVDFNKAFNPPCAYTDYATCPLPPPQNRLALRVEAGEKYAGH